MAKKAGCPVKILASKALTMQRHVLASDLPLLDWHVWLHLQVLLRARIDPQAPGDLLDSGAHALNRLVRPILLHLLGCHNLAAINYSNSFSYE